MSVSQVKKNGSSVFVLVNNSPIITANNNRSICLLYTSPSPRDS